MAMLSLKVPPETAARLARLAARRRIPKSAILREALERALRRADEETSPSVHDLMVESLGVVDSGVGDLSFNKSHLAGYGRRRSGR